MPDDLAQFANVKYFSLETFRKTGVGIATPVWFAESPSSSARATFYVYTLPDSGKVKRMRNNARVRIAPCNMRGNVSGTWVEAHARFCNDEEAATGQSLLIDKYGLMKRIGDFFSRLRGRTQCVLAIEVS
jgi:PPOX class probable F420-dependent enzyme